jgi:hypothetical protein
MPFRVMQLPSMQLPVMQLPAIRLPMISVISEIDHVTFGRGPSYRWRPKLHVNPRIKSRPQIGISDWRMRGISSFGLGGEDSVRSSAFWERGLDGRTSELNGYDHYDSLIEIPD